MVGLRVIDVSDSQTFSMLPPCADPRFDHRTCDYWENVERGSKLSRPAWLEIQTASVEQRGAAPHNPFAPPARQIAENPFAAPVETDPDNPFVPTRTVERPQRHGVPRKLALLDRGRGVFGSYAKLLLIDEEPVAYCQFGPLSAYPRAGQLRALYPQLPDAPLPAVITCIATTAEARGAGHARHLAEAVIADLAERGFAAVEAYPDLTLALDETSGARPQFWHDLDFVTAVDDAQFPVMRREL